MTNEELLARIDLQEARWSDERTYKALRAVVEIHQPIVEVDGVYCGLCQILAHPCPTIQVIEGVLND